MNPRAIASGLLLFTGVAHLAEYLLRSHDRGMAIAGAVYLALGIGLRREGKAPLIVSAILPAIGGLGGAARLAAGPLDPILAGMVAIDAVVVACCVLALLREPKRAAAA